LKPGEHTIYAWQNKSGEWDPKRRAFHDRVVDRILKGKTAPVGRAPIAILLGGGTASGKTSGSDALMKGNTNIVRIDSDEIRTALPEYAQLKQTDPQNASARVHEEASDITHMAVARAAVKGLDIVYDATTSGNGGPSMAKSLTDKGYTVRAAFFDVPLDVARQRADLRAQSSNDPINFGRIVPDRIIEQSHYGAAANFMRLKDMPEVSRKEFYDNSGPLGSAPKLVYSRDGMGPETIHDGGRWNEYRGKAAQGEQRAKAA
jgi:predicted kinase